MTDQCTGYVLVYLSLVLVESASVRCELLVLAVAFAKSYLGVCISGVGSSFVLVRCILALVSHRRL